MRQLMIALSLIALSVPFFSPWADSAQNNNASSDPQQFYYQEFFQPPPVNQPDAGNSPNIQTYETAVTKITVTYRSGQTYILWPERKDLIGEKYRVYRSTNPITSATLAQSTLLGEVGKDSARFYANRFIREVSRQWAYRFVDRFVIKDFGARVPVGTGLLVWTLSPQDFGGGTSGHGYYAVTVTPAGGNETLNPVNISGAVAEAVVNPSPVEIKSTTNENLSAGAHVFIQYMDLRNWNATFHAPNSTNQYYGFQPTDPGIADDLQYAYDYVVYLPNAAMCGGNVPAKLPVIITLHGARANTFYADAGSPVPYCGYVIYPEDETDTWWFGFAQNHDYRKDAVVTAGDTIVNYTEYRVLRMLYDLERKPLGPPVDQQRVYVEGQSMGGSGALAFAERYPNVFAAAYASQPITNFRTSGVTVTDIPAYVAIKWGDEALNLPVQITAPNGWAAPLQKYNGVGVWDWQDYQDSAAGTKLNDRLYDEMAPLGIIFGAIDHVVNWSTQGMPMVDAANAGRRPWGSMVTNDDHYWMYHVGLPPNLAPLPKSAGIYFWVPYYRLRAVKNETVPGLSNLSSNSYAVPGGHVNETIVWSSSWDAWDGKPIDKTALWQISLCSIPAGENTCKKGSSTPVTVDVTPRRLQAFIVTPGAQYDWQNYSLNAKAVIASGVITADSGGLLLVPGFQVTKYGNRLIIKPHG